MRENEFTCSIPPPVSFGDRCLSLPEHLLLCVCLCFTQWLNKPACVAL